MKKTGHLLFLVYVGLVLNVFSWALSIPYNNAPDESTHCTTAYFIYEHGRLPVFGRDQEATIDPVIVFNGRWPVSKQYPESTTEPVIGSRREELQITYNSMPYIGYIISAGFMKLFSLINPLYVTFYARLTSILSYALFVYFVWLIAGKAFGNEGPLRYLFPWFIANIPQVTFIAAYTNNDMISLAIAAIVIYGWWLLYDNRSDRLPNPTFWGLAAGLLAFARLNYWVLFPLTFLLYVIRAKQISHDNRKTLIWLGQVFGIAFLVCGWSLIRNTYLYGDPTGITVFLNKRQEAGFRSGELVRWQHGDWVFFHRREEVGFRSLSGRGVPFGTFLSVLLPVWVENVFASSLAQFHWMTLKVSPWIINLFKIGSVLAVLGILHYLIREHKQRGMGGKGWLYLFLSMPLPISAMLSLWSSYRVDFEPQGRYLFPGLIPAVMLFCAGWVLFDRSKVYQTMVAILLGTGIFVFNIYCLYGVIRPYYSKNLVFQHIRNTSHEWDYTFYKGKLKTGGSS